MAPTLDDAWAKVEWAHRQLVLLNPCQEWGPQAGYAAETWLNPLAAQVQQVRLDAETIADVVRVLEQPIHRTDELARQRIARRRKEAADKFATGSLTPSEFMASIAALDARAVSLQEGLVSPRTVSPKVAVAYLRDLRRLWTAAGGRERADLLHAIYRRVEVRGREFVGVTLTEEAEAHGLALALPESIALARPAGIEPAT